MATLAICPLLGLPITLGCLRAYHGRGHRVLSLRPRARTREGKAAEVHRGGEYVPGDTPKPLLPPPTPSETGRSTTSRKLKISLAERFRSDDAPIPRRVGRSPCTGWRHSLHGVGVVPTRGERPPYTGGTVSLHGAKGFPARVRREWYKQRKENEKMGKLQQHFRLCAEEMDLL